MEDTFTQEQVDTMVAEALEKQKGELEAKHNAVMTSQRKAHEKEMEKYKSNADLSADERAKRENAELIESLQNEVNDLKAYKKNAELTERLAKEQLPSFFKNDSRLLNAKDEKELEIAFKTIKTEYASSTNSGANHSTVVSGASAENGKTKLDGRSFDDIIRKKCGY